MSNRVQFYRTPLDKKTMARLNERSDFKGWLQTTGHLGLLLMTASAALYGAKHWAWWIVALIVFLHGMFTSFMVNAVHELLHRTVFKTRALNDFFVRVFSFLGWNNFPLFYDSHMRHHQYTLHQPDDLEVVLPMRLMVKHFFKSAFINPSGFIWVLKYTVRIARGKHEGEWEATLYPEDQSEKWRRPVTWARTLLAGHAAVLMIAVIFKLWLLPVLVTFGPFYGGWLFFLCNNTQHIGLQDGVADYRLCCRTFTLNPIAQFLYWHMNYHTEHHMYAAVPCYNLAALHRAIKYDLPPCPHGLLATWKEIAAIQKKQDEDPSYQHVALLPNTQAHAS